MQEIVGPNARAGNGTPEPAARGAAGSPWTTRRRLLHLIIPETMCFLARRELPVAAGETGRGPQESGGGHGAAACADSAMHFESIATTSSQSVPGLTEGAHAHGSSHFADFLVAGLPAPVL